MPVRVPPSPANTAITAHAAARSAGAALSAVTLVFLAACSGADDAAQGGPEPTASPDLSTFYDQELDWGTCEGKAASSVEEPVFVDPFQCSWMTVPLDYDDPEGETARIGVMRLPAKGAAGDRIGSLVLNPGGPGGSGMAQAASASVAFKDTVVARRFDVVGFDPRGVGASTPAISCFTEAQQDGGDAQTTLLGSAGSWTEDDTRDLMEDCAEGSGGEEVLGSVGTRDAARDLDVLREVLGDDKLTFAGQSYGTRLGAVYAEMFPNQVRAMVLDGVIDPRQGTAERRMDLHAGFQTSFDAMAASCAEQPDCPLGTEPDRATEEFQQLVRPLIDEPVAGSDGRPVDFTAATGGVTAGLYFPEQWPTIIDGIAQLKDQGRGDILLALGDAFGARAPDGSWNNQSEANLAINCNDEERRTPQEEAELRTTLEEISPFMSTGRDHEGVTRDACEAWPREPSLGFPYAQDVEGLPQTLIVSVTEDPSTPYAGGVSLADSIDGTLLRVEGFRHTVFQTGTSPCVTRVASAYLVDPDAEVTTRTCRL